MHPFDMSNMTTVSTEATAPLAQWLRLLWNLSPPLQLDSESPYIAAGEIHLPPCSHWRQHSAAAAHAAAHLVYSPRSFDGMGLGPIARALVALLEDARVEALAIRELPGLARIWRPLHRATPESGSSFESLMERLARSLAEPSYEDPDPWVRKGRVLFYLDAGLGLLALRTPAEVLTAAKLLAHDIGQMRLQFNVKTYRPVPAYRDDHRWMWPADVRADVSPSPVSPTGGSGNDDAQIDGVESISIYPEWDYVISRSRRDWCRVIERSAAAFGVARRVDEEAASRSDPRVRAALRALARAPELLALSEEGEVLDIEAAVDRRVSRRLKGEVDERVYRATRREEKRGSVVVLVDQSASTAAVHGAPGALGRSILQTATRCAETLAATLEATGVSCAVFGFNSRGRHAVDLMTMKAFDEPANSVMAARLRVARAAGSTRLGAALRHATHRLTDRPTHRRGGASWVLVISDGEAHDIDVHDPRYLLEDARTAVRDAFKRSVQIACLVIQPAQGSDSRRVFGRRRVEVLTDTQRLPWALARILV
jgi:nitric oxide reductase NorD protein